MHLLLEGPDLQELLAQVREDHGGAARVVRAERIRSGGVAGFFTKERYEVTVEVEGATAAADGSADAAGEQPASSGAAEDGEEREALDFEALSLKAKAGSDLDGLVEAARRSLGPAVAAVHEQDGVLHVITLDPLLEQSLAEALRPGEHGASLALDAATAEHLVTSSSSCLERAEQHGISAVLVCAPPLRAPLRRLLKVAVGRLHVLSYDDVSNHPRIETVGSVSGVHALAS